MINNWDIGLVCWLTSAFGMIISLAFDMIAVGILFTILTVMFLNYLIKYPINQT